jgi:hypothetical protein
LGAGRVYSEQGVLAFRLAQESDQQPRKTR